MGQKEEAKLNYQRAYALDNSFTEAKEAANWIIAEIECILQGKQLTTPCQSSPLPSCCQFSEPGSGM